MEEHNRWSSRKFILATAFVLIIFVLILVNKIETDEGVKQIVWILSFYLGAQGIEDASKGFNSKEK